MKTLKRVFKPVLVVGALFGVAALKIVKCCITLFKVKSQYKYVAKINQYIQKLYRVIFNPYRISNGIRPRLYGEYTYTAEDLERCHEFFVQRRQRA